jgi:hypothetical protein
MLDLAGIMASSIMMLLVIVRAVQLDNIQPWFQRPKQMVETGKAKPTGWRRKT